MKKFSRASREIIVTLICSLARFFSAFDIAEGIFFQRLLISAGGELAKPAQKHQFFVIMETIWIILSKSASSNFIQIQTLGTVGTHAP